MQFASYLGPHTASLLLSTLGLAGDEGMEKNMENTSGYRVIAASVEIGKIC